MEQFILTAMASSQFRRLSGFTALQFSSRVSFYSINISVLYFFLLIFQFLSLNICLVNKKKFKYMFILAIDLNFKF